MAPGFRLPLFCFLFALLAAGISLAAHSAPAPGVDCSSLILEMAECLPCVTEGGAAAKPSGGCCSGLKTVLKTDADCLCEAFKNSAQLGVTLNLTKALALPSVCHVSAPSVSNCALSNGAAPALSPFAVSPTSVAAAPSSSIGANEAAPAPSPGGGKSGSNALVISTQLLLCTTVIAVSYALF